MKLGHFGEKWFVCTAKKVKKIEQVPTEGEGWENLNPIIF